MNENLKQLCRKRDAALRKFKRGNDRTMLDEFLRLRRDTAEAIRYEKGIYIQDRLTRALNENGNCWKELRSLGLLPTLSDGLNGFLPDELNSHFADVSCSIADSPYDTISFIKDAPVEGFSFSSVTLSDVILAVAHFSSQAAGEDGIPQGVIAKALPVIGPVLVRIFNISLESGTFPGAWKKAQLLPFKKKSMPTAPSDFRPISILCFLSKVLEKIVHDQLLAFVRQRNIVDPFQAGFRQHHSTMTALLKLTDDIRTGFDNRLITILLLFDFSKAFDIISPTLLVRRLSRMGLSRSALCWVHSYLTGRQQQVVLKSDSSNWITTNLGVPQGSVLGPLLFCLYINDVQTVLNDKRVKHLLYADDLQIYVQIPREKFEEGVRSMSEAAWAVSEWAQGSRLHLNAKKTQAIFFAPSRTASTVQQLGISGIEMEPGTLIPFCQSVTNLGVVLDRTLSWKPHIDAITKKINRVMYALRFFRSSTTETLRQRLAQSLIFPHLDYCSVVLLDATHDQRVRLQRLQNTCIRYIYGLNQAQRMTPYRERLGWLRTDSRRLYFLAVLMYKVTNLREPLYLAELFEKHQPNRPVRGLRKDLKIPRVRTEFGYGSFQCQGAHLWNSLPEQIRYLPSLSRFKKAVKLHFMNLD